MDVNFKEASYNDVEGIISLCNECFGEHTEIEEAQSIFKQTEDDDNQIYIVGVVENKIIAHMKITVIETMYKPMGTYAILNHVCVKPEYRRHQIASKMLDYCMKICKEKGCVKMELWSNNFRVPAHACYKKYGFKVEDAKFFSKEVM